MSADVVLKDTPSVAVHDPQVALGLGIPPFSSEAVPPHSGLVVLRDTLSEFVHEPQIVLGGGKSLFSSERVPADPSLIVLDDAPTVTVHERQIVLGRGIPLFGQGRPFTQGSCEVTALCGSQSLIEILPARTDGREDKKGNGEGEYPEHAEYYASKYDGGKLA